MDVDDFQQTFGASLVHQNQLGCRLLRWRAAHGFSDFFELELKR
jgi:hypothetical protein